MPAYVIHYKKYVEDGSNRCGYSGYRDFVQFCRSESEFKDWMDSSDYMRKANYKGRLMSLTSIATFEFVEELDVHNASAASACRVDMKERAEKKAKLLKEREELDKQINEL
jgi:hypothetical protein